MIRDISIGFAFALLIFIAGCEAPGQPTAKNDDWFNTQNKEFDRQHAEHVKQSSKAVRDYQQYRNRQL